MYIYHFKRKNMIGDKLIPLNAQKGIFPELYNEREALLEKVIPILDCLWNDVLHFSSINPQLILDVYKEEDLVPELRRGEVFDVFKIPVQKLPESSTVCFQSYNFDPNLNKYWKFSRSDYEELTTVPEKQIEVWHQDKKAGRVIYWYGHIMHILSKTEVDISDCDVFQCQ